MVLAPSLPFEDGAKVFAYFYEQRNTIEILRFKSGYIPLVGNLIGYLAVRLPTRAIPYAFVDSAVAITSVTYVLFFLRAFRKWVPSDVDRALICILFALAPISDFLLVTMTDYSTWNLLATLILLTCCPPSAQRVGRYAHGFICNLLVWSHPLSIVIAPIVLWSSFKDEQNRTFYHVLLFSLVVHQVFGVSGIIRMQGLWEQGGNKLLIGLFSQLLHSCLWTIKIIIAAAFRTAFGSLLFQWAVWERPSLLVFWMAGLVAGCYLLARRDPQFRALLAFTSYLIVSLTFLSCFLRYEDDRDGPMAFINNAPRYIYLQSLCFLLLFGTVLVSAWEVGCSYLRSKWNRPNTQILSKLSFVPLAALLCHYFVLNTQFGHYFFKNTKRAGPYYDADARNGVIVREFFAQLAETEQRLGSAKGIELTAYKFNDWPISTTDTTANPPNHLRLSHHGRLFATALGLVAFVYITRRIWRPRLCRAPPHDGF